LPVLTTLSSLYRHRHPYVSRDRLYLPPFISSTCLTPDARSISDGNHMHTGYLPHLPHGQGFSGVVRHRRSRLPTGHRHGRTPHRPYSRTTRVVEGLDGRRPALRGRASAIVLTIYAYCDLAPGELPCVLFHTSTPMRYTLPSGTACQHSYLNERRAYPVPSVLRQSFLPWQDVDHLRVGTYAATRGHNGRGAIPDLARTGAGSATHGGTLVFAYSRRAISADYRQHFARQRWRMVTALTGVWFNGGLWTGSLTIGALNHSGQHSYHMPTWAPGAACLPFCTAVLRYLSPFTHAPHAYIPTPRTIRGLPLPTPVPHAFAPTTAARMRRRHAFYQPVAHSHIYCRQTPASTSGPHWHWTPCLPVPPRNVTCGHRAGAGLWCTILPLGLGGRSRVIPCPAGTYQRDRAHTTSKRATCAVRVQPTHLPTACRRPQTWEIAGQPPSPELDVAWAGLRARR